MRRLLRADGEALKLAQNMFVCAGSSANVLDSFIKLS